MREQRVEKFCSAMLLMQAVFFLLVAFHIVDPWFFPATVFFIVFVLLGAMGAIIGLGMIVKSLVHRELFRPELLIVCGMAFFSVLFMQLHYGWQNLDFEKANDYSTDIVHVPQLQHTKHERLHVKEASPVWGFMDIPHKISQADTDSIDLPMNARDTKIVLNQAIARLGWVKSRQLTNPSDDTSFYEIHEFLAGNALTLQRTDLLVRIVSTNPGSSIIDIRSSSPGRRRDLGFNAFMIRKLASEILLLAPVYMGVQDSNLVAQ